MIESQRGLISIVSLALALGGCAHGPAAPIEDRTADSTMEPRPLVPFPSLDGGSALGGPPPLPHVSADPARAAAAAPARHATRQLLAAADADITAGRFELAAASLDRAIRLAPDDALAWHKLAKLRFVQADYIQAKATAQRSSALPGATQRLIAANWLLIANIERVLGNEVAAYTAYAKARTKMNAVRHDGGRENQGFGRN